MKLALIVFVILWGGIYFSMSMATASFSVFSWESGYREGFAAMLIISLLISVAIFLIATDDNKTER